jgi:hypothetical protein
MLIADWFDEAFTIFAIIPAIAVATVTIKEVYEKVM